MQFDSRVNISISTNESYESYFETLGAHIVATPNSFRPSKAKYKARALGWYARYMDLDETDWVLHLDEEIVVDEHTIKSCIDFAEEQDEYNIGQVCPHHKNEYTVYYDLWLMVSGCYFI
jgi:hypothetical protein